MFEHSLGRGDSREACFFVAEALLHPVVPASVCPGLAGAFFSGRGEDDKSGGGGGGTGGEDDDNDGEDSALPSWLKDLTRRKSEDDKEAKAK